MLSGGSLSFKEIVRRAGGAFPTDVEKVLRSLIAAAEVSKSEGRYSLIASTGSGGIHVAASMHGLEAPPYRHVLDPVLGTTSTLADPHPADYDWRFTTSTLTKFAHRLQWTLNDESNVALFGIPTLFPCLMGSKFSVILFDRSPSLIHDLRTMGLTEGLVVHDLFYPIGGSRREFDVVVADPPWYPAFYRAFLLRASQVLRDEGELFLSVLPWLTRPTAINDRVDVLLFAAQAGFDLVESLPGALEYESPRFEQATLRLHGMDCGQWRTGDLHIFRRVNNPKPGLHIEPPADEPEWQEYRIGTRKVKLRRRLEPQGTGFSLQPVTSSGPILTSVSRRSRFRSRIDLWTSDNAAYSVEGMELLHSALKRLENGEPPEAIAASVGLEHMLSEENKARLANILSELVGQALS